MYKFAKRLLILVVLFGSANAVLADRGFGKRNKTKAVINVNTNGTSLRNAMSYNLKTGLSYRGTLLSSSKRFSTGMMNTSLVTYQKGNTTYIIPYKSKVMMPDIKQGYSGVKLIIKK
ncbi:hypothetical protein ACQ33O_06460 [Ferruginibacter sp. SUN002]|uniref:hypothetical protein n=1 Tax=Ferruginibacter sp. SUN002 TaxID=2937789 RepID=UPI003D35E2CC